VGQWSPHARNGYYNNYGIRKGYAGQMDAKGWADLISLGIRWDKKRRKVIPREPLHA